MSRFDKYRTEDDRPPLRKPEQFESFTAKLLGEHDFVGENGRVVPVLELTDEIGEFGWMVGPWHARDELSIADPQVGDMVRVTRLADKGKSHRYKIDVVQAAKAVNGDVPIDTSDLPAAGREYDPHKAYMAFLDHTDERDGTPFEGPPQSPEQVKQWWEQNAGKADVPNDTTDLPPAPGDHAAWAAENQKAADKAAQRAAERFGDEPAF